jgi:hypothetical protein
MDGCDHYAIDDVAFLSKWIRQGGGGGGTWTIVPGRVAGSSGLQTLRGSGAGNNPPFFRTRALAMGAAILAGWAHNTSIGGIVASTLDSAATPQIDLIANPNTGVVQVRNRAQTIIGSTAAGVYKPGLWQGWELYATFSATTGAVQLRVDGVLVLTLTNVNTLGGTAVATVNNLTIGSYDGNVNNNGIWDDIYVCDPLQPGLGSGVAAFLGDRRIITIVPTANSADGAAHTQLTPTGVASNFDAVNDAAPNSDTDYVASATIGQRDTYVCTDVPASVIGISAVQFNLTARKDDAPNRQLAALYRRTTGTPTDFQGGTTPNLSTTYQDVQIIAENSLATGVPWTPAEINTGEFGVVVVA